MVKKKIPFYEWLKKLYEPLTIVTFLLFISTFFLYWATRDLVRSAEDTAERQLRAYLAVSPKIDGQKFSLLTENYGQTPAQNVKLFSNWKILPSGEQLPEDFAYSDTETCPAGERKNSAIIFPRLPISTENLICISMVAALQKAIAGRENIFFYGRVEYVDIFDKPRHTDFCFWITEPSAIFCKNHNRVY